ncbi:MAG TPA: aspartate aminotransferase family protein [Gaiellaceae bacterium]|nr:aspartate aminotransferase family protein [Gaiellaceae bacterium]
MTERPLSRSRRLDKRARKVIPGGVNSNVRLESPPVTFSHGRGAWLWDVDGNDYVDYLLGQGAAFLGHGAREVVDAVQQASRGGLVYGSRHALEFEAAELLCSTVRWPEMVRFGSTGSEMVQAAIRVARAATSRPRFVRFEGHYHGWFDNVLVAPGTDATTPASAGQPADALAASILLPWNDLASVEHAFERYRDEIAAVLMEPMMLNAGAIVPRPQYLAGVRELCDRHDAILIFDEVITGFRLALGGAADRFGVFPDLAVYGKALGGGWPAAALAGRADIMSLFGTREVNHSGTFNGNVMAMAAVRASLLALRNDPPYARIERLGSRLADELRRLGGELSLPLNVQGLPVALHVSFGPGEEIVDARGLEACDSARYRRFAEALAEAGVWVAARGIWYLSAAHAERELDVTVERVAAALATLAVNATKARGSIAR